METLPECLLPITKMLTTKEQLDARVSNKQAEVIHFKPFSFF
jgi:hypothetical protein